MGLILKLTKIKCVWYLIGLTLGNVSRIYSRLLLAHNFDENKHSAIIAQHHRLREIFHDLVVLNGPFKGMRYPADKSVGSSFFPKLIGSYESELHGVIKKTLSKPYSSLVDIGCAEGYYAVGFATKFKGINVYAYDVDPTARELCHEMALLNGVHVEVSGFCSKKTLLNLQLGTKALIFCDCEGYEDELFDEELAENLAPHDLIIETHDFIRLETTKTLLEIFSKTHNCKLYESVDDTIKAYSYEYPQAASYSLSDRKLLFAENRPEIMRWIHAVSIVASPESP